jgi:hypothetical protein
MLDKVPLAIRKHARLTVIKHPNNMDCTVWRKRVTRIEVDVSTGDESLMGGSPTLGGMGVLRSEDEAQFDYQEIGPGKMLLVGMFQPSSENDQGSALLAAPMQEALIESDAEPGQAAYFEADMGDLVLQQLGLGVFVAYSVEDIVGNVGIPPYTRKFVLQPRDDLHNLEPFTDTTLPWDGSESDTGDLDPASPSLTFKPANLSIEFVAGDDVTIPLTLSEVGADGAKVPVNLAGSVITGRFSPPGANVLAVLFTVTDSQAGKATLTLTRAQTESLNRGASAVNATWDVQVMDSSGAYRTYISGAAKVLPKV